jgi:hypothetical protein
MEIQLKKHSDLYVLAIAPPMEALSDKEKLE